MLDWMKRRGATALPPGARHERGTRRSRTGRVMSGKYLLLYKYLENRYADTVVLTFAEIEDLLGFPLPEQARLQREWWTDPGAERWPITSDSWILASRTAVPNLRPGSSCLNALPDQPPYNLPTPRWDMKRKSAVVCLLLFAFFLSPSSRIGTGLSAAQNGENAARQSPTFTTRVLTTGLEGPWELSLGTGREAVGHRANRKTGDEDRPRGRFEGCRADDSRRAPERRAGRPSRHGAPS